jgi:hypothetical protein
LIFSDSITSGRWIGVWFIRRPQIDLGMCYCVLCCCSLPSSHRRDIPQGEVAVVFRS